MQKGLMNCSGTELELVSELFWDSKCHKTATNLDAPIGIGGSLPASHMNRLLKPLRYDRIIAPPVYKSRKMKPAF